MPPSARRRRPWRWIAGVLLAAYFVTGLGFLAVRHWVWPRLDSWRPVLEARLAAELGVPVRLGHLAGDFDRLRPRFVVEGMEIGAGDPGETLRVERMEAVVGWRSVLARAPVFRRLRLDVPLLEVVRLDVSRFRIAGLVFDASAPVAGSGPLEWFLAQRALRVHGERVRYVDARSGASGELTDVALALDTSGRTHRLSASAKRDIAVPGPVGTIELAGEIDRDRIAGGVAGWTGQAYAAFEDADVPALAALADVPSPLVSGHGRGRLWFERAAGEPAAVHGELALDGPALRTSAGPARAAALSARLVARWREDGQYDVLADDIELVDATGAPVDALREQQALRLAPDGRVVHASLHLGAADADGALRLVRSLPLPDGLAEEAARWRATGRIEGASLDWQAGDGGPDDFRFEMRFAGLGLGQVPDDARRTGAFPSARGLTGRVRLAPAGGELELDGTGAVLSLPGVFEQPDIPVDRYDARIDWQHDGSAPLRVRIAQARFENADAAGEVHGHWQANGKGPGVIDLDGRLTRARAARVWRYLPLAVDRDVREWVHRAVRAGRSNDVGLRLRGDLEHFPFPDPAQGEFVVRAAIEAGQLAFDPDWPALEAVHGELRFERDAMVIDKARAQFAGATLDGVVAGIDDLDHALLHVRGRAAGPLEDMVRVLVDTPLREHVGDAFERMAFDGPATLALELELPLADMDASRVTGRLELPGNRFVPLAGLPPFEKVAGELSFTEAGARFDRLRAQWLGGPLTVTGSSAGTEVTAHVTGRASAAGLAALASSPLAEHLAGGFDYRGEVRVGRSGALRVTATSELTGLGIDLPAPLAKDEAARRPATLEIVTGSGGAADRLRVHLGTKEAPVELLAETDPAADGRIGALRRAAVGIGLAAKLPDSGLVIAVQMPELDVDRWRELADAAPAGPAGELPMPEHVQLQVGVARLAGRRVEDLVVDATRSADTWRASVRSRQADGGLVWRGETGPDGAGGKLSARFARLEIPEDDRDEISALLADGPRTLPALDIRAEHFRLGARDLGRLELVAQPAPSRQRGDWLIERLVLEQPAGRLDATGRWEAAVAGGPARREVALDFGLDIHDGGGLLDALGFKGLVQGGSGTLGGKVRWQGSPLALDLPSLAGTLRVRVGKGQFLQAEPGIAKLIGVLNLQALPRRLGLDFRDVFARGFAFDQIEGSAELAGGVARTRDLAMAGVQALVTLEGEVDLVHETQALHVAIQPQVDAGLASLAYGAMVNPAVGIGSFVAQWMLRKPLSEALAREFTVTGAWHDPQVQPVAREAPETDAGSPKILP